MPLMPLMPFFCTATSAAFFKPEEEPSEQQSVERWFRPGDIESKGDECFCGYNANNLSSSNTGLDWPFDITIGMGPRDEDSISFGTHSLFTRVIPKIDLIFALGYHGRDFSAQSYCYTAECIYPGNQISFHTTASLQYSPIACLDCDKLNIEVKQGEEDTRNIQLFKLNIHDNTCLFKDLICGREDQDEKETILKFLLNIYCELKRGKKAFIHCAAGRGRSAEACLLFYLLYKLEENPNVELIKSTKFFIDQVRRVRPSMFPILAQVCDAIILAEQIKNMPEFQKMEKEKQRQEGQKGIEQEKLLSSWQDAASCPGCTLL
jgi:hypothetical protein